MHLVDSHAHLDFPEFDADREAVIARARDAGVELLLSIGSGAGPDRLDAAIPFAQRYPWIYASVGVHPHDAARISAAHDDALRKLGSDSRVIGWGEIGLDYHYPQPPPEVQQRVFRRQLDLAAEAKLPVIIHCRQAWGDCLRILAEQWAPTNLGGILHCFSGTLDDARRAIGFGFLVSFAGNVTYPKAAALRSVAAQLPPDCLLAETDCPYLAPQRFRGKRNEPAHVAEVVRALAALHQAPEDALAAALLENFRNLFRLPVAASGATGKLVES
jgi:TatD DNase family protein